LSTSPISKLRAANDERRQAKRSSLADKLAVEAKARADLKIEKAVVDGQRGTVEADLVGETSRHPPRPNRRGGAAVVHPRRGAAARPGRGAPPTSRRSALMIRRRETRL
jgi:hypothetical protein